MSDFATVKIGGVKMAVRWLDNGGLAEVEAWIIGNPSQKYHARGSSLLCAGKDGDLIGDNNHVAEIALRSISAAALGRRGGTSKSDLKSASSRENGKKGGRPKKP